MKVMFEFSIFEIQNFQTTLDGEMTKTKVLDIENLCNFVVDNFSFEIIYPTKNRLNFHTFEISNSSNDQTKQKLVVIIFKTTSDGEMTKTKVVDLIKL